MPSPSSRRSENPVPDHVILDNERIRLLPPHRGQMKAHLALLPYRFKALRCGRRFGKTDLAKTWIAEGLIQGQECAWFAPRHNIWSEVYSDLARVLRPILEAGSKSGAVMRFKTGGRLVIPVDDGQPHQSLLLVEKGADGKITTHNVAPVMFVPLTRETPK